MTQYIPARFNARYGASKEVVFDELANSILEEQKTIYLIVAPYGCGKTRFCEELSAYVGSVSYTHLTLPTKA